MQTGVDMEDLDDCRLVLEVAIKCSDVSNPAKPRNLCLKWTELIMEEFFRQGDEEARRGIPVSMFMDRMTTNVPKCQVGFIEFIVGPMYDVWLRLFDEEDQHVKVRDCLNSNAEYWRSLQEQQSAAQQPTKA
eukprot:Colp12_sorted_trinity150504_noHs@31856